MNEKEEHQEIDLMKFWMMIVRRKWVIVIFASAVFLYAVISTFTTVPIYRATTTLLIEEDASKMLQVESEFGYTRKYLDSTIFNTQLNLLKSRTLAERVAKELNLLSRPEFGAGKKMRRSLLGTLKYIIMLKWISTDNNSKNTESLPEVPSNPYSGIAHAIRNGLVVEPIQNTTLVEVSFSSPSPGLTAEILNSMAQEFMKFSVEKRSATSRLASNFLSEVIVDLNEKMDSKNQELQKFGNEKDIPFSGALSERESSALNSFQQYELAHAQAMIDLTSAQIEYQKLRNFDLESPSEVVDDPVIKSLQSELRRLRSDYNEQRSQLGTNHPRMISLKTKINTTENQLQDAYQKAVETAESDYRTALETEKRLKKLRDQESIKMGSSGSRYRRLQIELENLTSQLNTYTQMREEAGISSQLAGFSTSNISVVDQAEIPRSPISPNKKKNLLLALLVGLFGGAGLCFLLEYLDNTINSAEDVENLTGLPSLGIVPYLPPEGMEIKKRYGYLKKLGGSYHSYGDENPGDEEALENVKEIELVNFLFPRFFISEDYRTIRTSILLSYAESPPKTIVLSSALPSEGKTTTVANLAVAFSQISKKVLMLDTDLRKPRLNKIFKVKNIGGLSGFLTGKINLEDALKMTAVDNVWILPSGPIPPNPSELLNSDKMKEMLDQVSNHFDIILLDSPPLLAAIDTVVISSLVDAVLLIIRSGKTSKNAFLRAYEEAHKAKANVMGVVLNEHRLGQQKYYYKDYYQRGMDSQDEA